ncbi:MAG: type I 3-dehydroquinate dehydratase [Comamonadaceae bacterium]|nr:MAG: type I 3-dehydroquinate dehydratase [Comamonadaceae bacterium]
MKAIALKKHPGAAGKFPLVCAPLVARDRATLLAEAAAVAARGPDILEWRVDFFEGIGRSGEVAALCGLLKEAAGGLPLLFTRRSAREGGQPIGMSEAQVLELYAAVCAAGQVDLIDFEMGNAPQDVAAVREMSRVHGMGLVLSFHDFQQTPTQAALLERFARAQELGADVAKVAVMPQRMEDVLTLLAATLQASQALTIPVVSMAMGALGASTRLCGGAFGSALTFAVGQSASAPGQMPIAELSAALALLRKAGAGA